MSGDKLTVLEHERDALLKRTQQPETDLDSLRQHLGHKKEEK